MCYLIDLVLKIRHAFHGVVGNSQKVRDMLESFGKSVLKIEKQIVDELASAFSVVGMRSDQDDGLLWSQVRYQLEPVVNSAKLFFFRKIEYHQIDRPRAKIEEQGLRGVLITRKIATVEIDRRCRRA